MEIASWRTGTRGRDGREVTIDPHDLAAREQCAAVTGTAGHVQHSAGDQGAGPDVTSPVFLRAVTVHGFTHIDALGPAIVHAAQFIAP